MWTVVILVMESIDTTENGGFRGFFIAFLRHFYHIFASFGT